MNIPKDFTTIRTAANFHSVALETFRFQYETVSAYRKFCDLLQVAPDTIQQLEDIPFLPIQFFKSKKIIAQSFESEKLFKSSGTTGVVTSKHHVARLENYRKSFRKGFEFFYGSPSEYTILALLPSYLSQGNSSLVYMVDRLIKDSYSEHSGFYLDNLTELCEKLDLLEAQQQKTILLGVSYALLDLIEKRQFSLKHTLVMETGGMKGRRKELIKPELHEILKQGFGVSKIHSEYGMTELLSQAYSTGNGIYRCPPWMKINTRDTEDALTLITQKTGGINVIDLANTYSCSFIATQDLGKVHPDGSFEVMGRFDNSDIRGCNLMVL
ncbi:MAG: acyl transferase [Marinirhabdus sp.]|nr:acyl transferase [Marinirhabdus sp.]